MTGRELPPPLAILEVLDSVLIIASVSHILIDVSSEPEKRNFSSRARHVTDTIINKDSFLFSKSR